MTEVRVFHEVVDTDAKGVKGGTIFRLNIIANIKFFEGHSDLRETTLKTMLADIEEQARKTFKYVDSNIVISE